MKTKHFITAALFTSTLLLTGCAKEEPKTEPIKNETEVKNEVVREKGFKVVTADLNKDGKVFQCPMDVDFEVISDKSESCPKCKMDLEEVTVETAQSNLDSK